MDADEHRKFLEEEMDSLGFKGLLEQALEKIQKHNELLAKITHHPKDTQDTKKRLMDK